jgi:hypothetical protein
MTTHPITLTPSQLRAALAGRLEQVRMPVEPQPTGHDLEVFESAYGWESDIHGKFYGLVSGDMGYDETSYRCPWGVVGDRLTSDGLTFYITGIRVEQLQDISEQDAEKCGCDGDCPVGYIPAYLAGKHSYHFAYAWEEQHGQRHPWASSPWVWVIDVRKVGE